VTTPANDEALAAFERERARLLRIAHRMLGSVAEAEDVVQAAWIRWQTTNTVAVDNPAAWLTRTVSRLAIDVLRSARVRREVYVGPWLPEPAVADNGDELADDALSTALMLALERLSPLERAAFLLHDVFGVPFSEIAQTLQRDPAAARQLAARARRHVREARPRFLVSPEQ
jgi:RNA polymerase sigma-70 factor (ECF subfamily)